MSTALKNQGRYELKKKNIRLSANLGIRKSKDLASSLGFFEVAQNVELLDAVEMRINEAEARLEESTWM